MASLRCYNPDPLGWLIHYLPARTRSPRQQTSGFQGRSQPRKVNFAAHHSVALVIHFLHDFLYCIRKSSHHLTVHSSRVRYGQPSISAHVRCWLDLAARYTLWVFAKSRDPSTFHTNATHMYGHLSLGWILNEVTDVAFTRC